MTAITAMTKRIWMSPPDLKEKNPIAQTMTKITATVYNNFPILFIFLG